HSADHHELRRFHRRARCRSRTVCELQRGTAMTGIRRAPQSETSTDATAELELQRVSDLKARARAESTTRHHRAHWQPFKRWCEANGLDPMAIDDRTVCAYLYGLLEEGGSFSRI